jgi:hypothetical protein
VVSNNCLTNTTKPHHQKQNRKSWRTFLKDSLSLYINPSMKMETNISQAKRKAKLEKAFLQKILEMS